MSARIEGQNPCVDGSGAVELVSEAAEAIHALARVTLPGTAVYEYPADVSAVIGSLGVLAQDLPQSLRQAGRWLADAHARGAVRDVEAASDAETAWSVCAVIVGLSDAATHVERAAARLRDAHSPAARLAAVDIDAPIPFVPTDLSATGGES